MELWQTIVLGLVEGISEFLPISSTGHLLLTQRAMGIVNGEAANAFAVCIQAGAILAVLAVFTARVREMVAGVFAGNKAGQQLTLNVLIAFLPAAMLGVLLDKHIERHLFGLWPIVIAWIVGGIAIFVTRHWRERSGHGVDSLSVRHALIIGLCQCLALWPGTSRSLVTILGGLYVGLSLAAAVEFSFILGLVTLTAATLYKGYKSGGVLLHTYGAVNIAVGFLVAAISAWVAVKWMLAYLNKHGLEIFAWYRIALAVVVAGLIVAGVLVA